MKEKRTPDERKERQRCAPSRIGAKGTGQVGVTHAFAPGDKVIVYRLALCSRPFIEGSATILDPIPHIADLYRVRFDGERRQLHRLVHAGAWQSGPDGLLRALLAHWRGTINPEIFSDISADVRGSDAE
jgi:hypothetical protein